MRVGVIEFATAGAIAESLPVDHAVVVVSPWPGGDRFRRVGQPEMIELQRLQPLLAIEHGHELAMAAAIAPQSDPGVIRQVAMDVGELGMHARSEERRGGKECVSTCRSRWLP